MSASIPETEMHWVCYGYDEKQQRYDALGYWCASAEQAAKRCKQLHPSFEILYVGKGNLN